MLVRRFAAVFASVALVLGTTACSLGATVSSLQPYSPSDGQQVTLDAIKARNFIYLVAESGNGYLIGSIVNSSATAGVVKLQYVNPESKEKTDFFFDVEAGAKLDFGYNGSPAIEVPVVERPGQTAQFYVLESDTLSGSMRVPVLDGTLSEYRMLLEMLEAAN